MCVIRVIRRDELIVGCEQVLHRREVKGEGAFRRAGVFSVLTGMWVPGVCAIGRLTELDSWSLHFTVCKIDLNKRSIYIKEVE